MSAGRVTLAGLLAGFLSITLVVVLLALGAPDPLALAPLPAPSAAASTGPAPTPPPSTAPSASAPPSVAPSAPASTEPSASPTVDPGAAFGVGAPAPGLRLPQLGNATFDLAALRGKAVWVVFTATWCPSCRDDASAMNSFGERHARDGLVVVAVDVREDESTLTAFASSADPTYPIAMDRDGAAARTWGVMALPTHFFVDPQGIVRAGATGTIGRDLIASSLAEILPGVTVTP